METFEELFPTIKKHTNYKKWAFRFFIYIIILNIFVAQLTYRMMTETVFDFQLETTTVDNRPLYIAICSIAATILLIAGIVLTVLSVQNKEQKNYQYYTIVIGYPIFIILTAISMIYNTLL